MKFIIFVFVIAMEIFLPVSLHAERISVRNIEKQNNLKNAIQNANPYDTLVVAGEVFVESDIVINKPIYLLGINCPVLDGKNKGNVIQVQAVDVIIDGFEIINSGRSSVKDFAGVRVEKSKKVTIKNCFLKNNYFGIFLLNSDSCSVINNTIAGNAVNETTSGNGIHLWKCRNTSVTGNSTFKNRDGIYLEFAEECTILNNYSASNIRYGLHFMFSHGNKYRSNRFTGNGAGVAVMYTQKVEMSDNIFEDNWGTASYGLLLKDISDSKIQGNKFFKNTIGIHMEGVKNVNVSKNIFKSNGWGMKLLGNCVEDTIINNDFMSNTFDVVTNSFSSESSNLFTKNYWDRYEGYDRNKDKVGDIPFRPVSLFSVYVERIPNSIVLLRTFLINLLDSIERALPAVIPETLVDNQPLIQKNIQ